MERILTPDFETGFGGGFMWRGLDGLRDPARAARGLLRRAATNAKAPERTRLRTRRCTPGTRLHFLLPSLGVAVAPSARSSRATATTSGGCVTRTAGGV